ncbi:MAG: sugar phosphate nucleotidyltransferase [bacterium]|nr:sugar phosphate nucleotidyltransferase [bacterium]MDD5353886.1 sugar phosphate nucleotidyltransferase [bacterium]MDD5756998.1 sugar phosphate nucleotidyltransferase [bacterium]
MFKGFASVILGAGEGTRMKSTLPKVLHTVGGKPLVDHVLDTVLSLGMDQQILVLGFRGKTVAGHIQDNPGYGQVTIVFQAKRLGSGHAVLQSAKVLAGYRGNVLVLCADVPLITKGTLQKLMTLHQRQGNAATILTTVMTTPTGYGRIIRAGDQVVRIAEEKDASEQEKQVQEINTGIYCFQAPELFRILRKIKPNNQKKEYYLTDAIGLLQQEGACIGALVCTSNQEVAGINDQHQLAAANAYYTSRKL